MADHVRNVLEWVADRQFNGEGLDNGIDGLWMTHLQKQTDTHNSTPTGFDLLRGTVPDDKTAGTDLDHTAPSGLNGDAFWDSSNLMAALRGGAWYDAAYADRWYFDLPPFGRN